MARELTRKEEEILAKFFPDGVPEDLFSPPTAAVVIRRWLFRWLPPYWCGYWAGYLTSRGMFLGYLLGLVTREEICDHFVRCERGYKEAVSEGKRLEQMLREMGEWNE
jgi:hypothetical protein